MSTSEVRREIQKVSVAIPVFRDADRAIELVGQLRKQQLPSSVGFEVLLVDDGSGDGTADRIEAACRDVRIVRLKLNSGRATVRNHAAEHANGDVILFVDSDCLPASSDLIAQHLAGWSDGVVASIGPVVGDGTSFWHYYQSEASERRQRQHADGISYSGSSQNLMVARWAFMECGGFDAGYLAYGFEDRDLQVRLSRLGRTQWASNAVVKHMDKLSLCSVSHKMLEAGERSSGRFAAAHPDAYRALGYAAIDVRQHPWLHVPAGLSRVLRAPLARLGDSLLERDWLPYAMKRSLVHAITGISYLAGTSLATRQGLHSS